MSAIVFLECCMMNLPTLHTHSSGWLICQKCRHKVKEKRFRNTNRKRHEDKNFDASESAHSIKPKGSYNMCRNGHK